MQESKEAGPHITTKEELDALYKNIINQNFSEEKEVQETENE